MSGLTAKEFIDVLRQSGLVEPDRLNQELAACKQHHDDRLPSEAVRIASFLVQRQLITKWHWEKLRHGKHKGFFIGQYKLMNHLGKGGMSSVYLAEHVHMKRRAAIKVLPRSRVNDASYLGRFYLEARAAASLDHPNIVRAYDVSNDGDLHYLVMEYIDGSDLHKIVRKRGSPLPVESAVDVILQVARALDHAHRAGLVHRDIKPGNLLIDSAGVVKVSDLGLAKLTTNDSASLTLAHDESVLGTADYLSPEQAVDSHQVDARSDIYSLGCTLYYLLTGKPPFPDGSLVQRINQHQKAEPRRISELRTDCPSSLCEICQRMMQKNPDQRIQTAEKLIGILEEWLTRQGELFHTALASAEDERVGAGHPLADVSIDADSPSRRGLHSQESKDKSSTKLNRIVAEKIEPHGDVSPSHKTENGPASPSPTIEIFGEDNRFATESRIRRNRRRIKVPIWLWIGITAAVGVAVYLAVQVAQKYV